MDAQDFKMPSPKRQRTESPRPALPTNAEDTVQNQAVPESTPISEEVGTKPVDNTAEASSTIPGLGLPVDVPEPRPVEAQIPASQSNGFLDALMQHVESMSQPQAGGIASETVLEAVESSSAQIMHIAENSDEAALKGVDMQPEQHTALPVPVPATLQQQPTEGAERDQQKTNTDKGGTTEQPSLQEGIVSSSTKMEEDEVMAEVQPETSTESRAVDNARSQDQMMSETQQETAADTTWNGEAMSQNQLMSEARQPGFEPTPAENANTTVNGTITIQDQTMIEAQQPDAEPIVTEGAEWEVDSSPYVSSDSDDSSDTSSDDSDDADGDYAMLNPEEQARVLMAGDGGSDDEGEKKGKTDGGHLRTANEKIEEVIPKPDIVVTGEMKIEELGVVEGIVEKTVLVRAKVSGEYQVLESNSLLCLENRSVIGVVAEPLGRVEQPMYTIRFTNDEAIKEAGVSERGTRVFYVPQHSTFVFTQPLKAVKGSDASNFHDEEVGDEEMEFSDDEQEAEHKRQMKMKRQGRRDDQTGGRGRGRGGRGNYQRGGRQDQHAPPHDAGSVYSNAGSEISYDDLPDGTDEGYTPLSRPANLSELMAGVQREPMEGSHHAGGFSDRGTSDPGRGRGRGRGRASPNYRGGRGGRGGGGTQPSWTTYQNTSAGQSNGYAPQSMMPPPGQFPYQYQQQQPLPPRLSPQTQGQAFSPSPISPLAPNQFNFNFQQQQQQWPGARPYQQQQQYGQMPQGGVQHFAPGQQPGQAQGHANAWNQNQAGAAFVAAQLEQFRRSQQGQ
jgi:H/ACA ribonucleoprotein complex non-core subunit NAF1